ncbi:hypothetical protein NFI00_000022 [Salmonella enterica]|nr:hypothetical protein [Salmonella enterica]
MATRVFAASIDKSIIAANEELQPLLSNQAVDWDSFLRTSPIKIPYVWDGPNVNTIWDILVTYGPSLTSADDSGFVLPKELAEGFVADGLEQTEGFVRNKFLKLQSLIKGFDFDNHCLVFFFS